MTLICRLASEEVLDAAYDWLCKRRRDYPANADVWTFRFRWQDEKTRLRAELLAGRYRFEPLSRVTNREGEVLHLWSARDALVLKALAIVLGRRLSISPHCVHVKGHGGSKAAVRDVMAHLPDNAFVLKTDVKSYYESIDHDNFIEQLAPIINDRLVLNLLWQYVRRTVSWGGLYRDCERGLSRGCPLSPLMGAFFLGALDTAMAKLGLFYVRFMDDIVVLSPTRWKLRKAIAVLNGVLSSLRLEKHPDKTYIGRIEKGFDFLGYHFGPEGLSMAEETWKKFVERATRLYEQERGRSDGLSALGMYVRRWNAWSTGETGDESVVKLTFSLPSTCGAYQTG